MHIIKLNSYFTIIITCLLFYYHSILLQLFYQVYYSVLTNYYYHNEYFSNDFVLPSKIISTISLILKYKDYLFLECFLVLFSFSDSLR